MEESDPPSPPGRDDFHQGGRSPGRSYRRNRAHPYERIPRRDPRTNDTPSSVGSDGASFSSRMVEQQPPIISQSGDTRNLPNLQNPGPSYFAHPYERITQRDPATNESPSSVVRDSTSRRIVEQHPQIISQSDDTLDFHRLQIREDVNFPAPQNNGPSDRCSYRYVNGVSQGTTDSQNHQDYTVNRIEPTSPPEPAMTSPGGSPNKQDVHQVPQKSGSSNTKNRHHPYERTEISENHDPKSSGVSHNLLPPCFGKESCDCVFESCLELSCEESLPVIERGADLLRQHSSEYLNQFGQSGQTTSALSPSEGLTSDSEPMSSEGLPETPRIQDSPLSNEERLGDTESASFDKVSQKQEGDDLKTSTSDVSTSDDRNLKETEGNAGITTSRTKQNPSVPGDFVEPKERAGDSASSEDSEINLETVGSPLDRLQDTPLLTDSESINVERSEEQESVSFVGVLYKHENEDLDIYTEEVLTSDDLNIKEHEEIDQKANDSPSSDDPEINLDLPRSSTPLKGLQDMPLLLDSSLGNVEGPQDPEVCQNEYIEDSKSSAKHDHSYASTAPGSPESPYQDEVHSERADYSSSSGDLEVKLEQPGSPTPSESLQATLMLADPASLTVERSEEKESSTSSKVNPETYDQKSSLKLDHSYASSGPASPENSSKQEGQVHSESIDWEKPNERADDHESSQDLEMKLEQPGSHKPSSGSPEATSMSTDSTQTYDVDDDSESSSNVEHSASSQEPNREALAYLLEVSESFMQMETFKFLHSVSDSFIDMDTSQREKSHPDQEPDDDFEDRDDVSSSDDSF